MRAAVAFRELPPCPSLDAAHDRQATALGRTVFPCTRYLQNLNHANCRTPSTQDLQNLTPLPIEMKCKPRPLLNLHKCADSSQSSRLVALRSSPAVGTPARRYEDLNLLLVWTRAIECKWQCVFGLLRMHSTWLHKMPSTSEVDF